MTCGLVSCQEFRGGGFQPATTKAKRIVALCAMYFWAGHAPAGRLLSFACPKEM
jgi:hypothetical protein